MRLFSLESVHVLKWTCIPSGRAWLAAAAVWRSAAVVLACLLSTHRRAVRSSEASVHTRGVRRIVAVASMSSSSSVSAYLDGELESHACSICYELMEPPVRSPILLFPCGHTLCKDCLAHHLAASRASTCALCRAPIKSQAVNISLQQIIQSMAAKRAALQKQQVQGAREDGVDEETDVSKYVQQYHQYSLRCAVLRTKLQDLDLDQRQAESDLHASQLVSAHLSSEEQLVIERLRAVESELELVRSHLAAQAERQTELRDLHQRHEDSKAHIMRIITPLERDRDKAELIVRRLAPTVKLEPMPAPERRERPQPAVAAANDTTHTATATPAHHHAESTASRSSAAATTSAARPTSNAPPFNQSPYPWTFPARPGR